MNRRHSRQYINKINLKNKYTEFVHKNCDRIKCVDIIEKFVLNYFICGSKVDDYMNGIQNNSKHFVMLLAKTILLIQGIRFAISGLINKQYVRGLLCDSFYKLGNQMLWSIMISISAFVVLAILCTVQYKEYNNSLKWLPFLFDLKHNRLPLPLNYRNSQKLLFRTSILAKYYLNQSYWALVVVSNGYIMYASVTAYLDPNSEFYIIGILLWSPCTLIWSLQFYI